MGMPATKERCPECKRFLHEGAKDWRTWDELFAICLFDLANLSEFLEALGEHSARQAQRADERLEVVVWRALAGIATACAGLSADAAEMQPRDDAD